MMKVKTLLRRIMPTPWVYNNSDTDTMVRAVVATDAEGHAHVVCGSLLTRQPRDRDLAELAYIAHACNLFPRLLEVVQQFHADFKAEGGIDPVLDNLLKQADNVVLK